MSLKSCPSSPGSFDSTSQDEKSPPPPSEEDASSGSCPNHQELFATLGTYSSVSAFRTKHIPFHSSFSDVTLCAFPSLSPATPFCVEPYFSDAESEMEE